MRMQIAAIDLGGQLSLAGQASRNSGSQRSEQNSKTLDVQTGLFEQLAERLDRLLVYLVHS